MSLLPGQPLLEALTAALAFHPIGETTGNLTLGRGRVNGRTAHVAIVESRAASGSIGTVEVKRLAPLLRIVARERSPLVLYIDSAGARVSEGLRALGAFRTLFREALHAAASGAPIVALLGRNCFGGASMVAHLAARRLFSPGTQLAMSGPSILASAAGADVLDEMFRAMAQAAIGAPARAKASEANAMWEEGRDPGAWIAGALAPEADPAAAFRQRHEALGRRLPPSRARVAEAVRRRDLDRIYAEGYEGRESDGLITGEGRREGRIEPFLGLVGNAPLGAERAWRFAQCAWELAPRTPGAVHVFLDCESHAARLEDEKIVLSEYIVGMSLSLAALATAGARIELTVLGRAGGGVYVALAAPAARVSALHGAEIQVLPGAAVAAILGESREAIPDVAEYLAAGVADAELKLGLVP